MKRKTLNVSIGKPVSFSADAMAKAVYIGFSNNPVARTERKGSSFAIDYGKDGRVIGIEIIRVRRVNATITKLVKDAEHDLPTSVRKRLDSYLEPAMV